MTAAFGRTRRSAVRRKSEGSSKPRKRKADVLVSQGSSLANSTLAWFDIHAHSSSLLQNTPHCRSKQRYFLPGARMP